MRSSKGCPASWRTPRRRAVDVLPKLLASYSPIQTALPVLADAALKGAILVVIAAAAAYLLRKRSAASRHAAWTAAVIGHLALPALVLLLPAWQMPLVPAASRMRVESAQTAAGAPIKAPGANAAVDAGKPVT